MLNNCQTDQILLICDSLNFCSRLNFCKILDIEIVWFVQKSLSRRTISWQIPFGIVDSAIAETVWLGTHLQVQWWTILPGTAESHQLIRPCEIGVSHQTLPQRSVAWCDMLRAIHVHILTKQCWPSILLVILPKWQANLQVLSIRGWIAIHNDAGLPQRSGLGIQSTRSKPKTSVCGRSLRGLDLFNHPSGQSTGRESQTRSRTAVVLPAHYPGRF